LSLVRYNPPEAPHDRVAILEANLRAIVDSKKRLCRLAKLPRVSERPNRWLTRKALLCFGNRSVVGRLTTVKSGWTTLSDKSFES
jgi:hypothetical protein